MKSLALLKVICEVSFVLILGDFFVKCTTTYYLHVLVTFSCSLLRQEKLIDVSSDVIEHTTAYPSLSLSKS